MSNQRSWPKKFAVAVSGIIYSARHHDSFWVHLPISVAVILLAAWLRVDSWRWVALIAAITSVWSLELFNTAIEDLVRAIHPDHDDRIGRALDASAGAVLVATLGAIAIGLMVLALPLWKTLVG